MKTDYLGELLSVGAVDVKEAANCLELVYRVKAEAAPPDERAKLNQQVEKLRTLSAAMTEWGGRIGEQKAVKDWNAGTAESAKNYHPPASSGR